MKNCSRCLLNNSVLSSLTLDENLICQFCKIHEEMEKEYPKKLQKSNEIYNIAEQIKNEGRNKKHNCIVGVSGGRDSSYLLYFLKKKLNLNPLAVHYDNGFDSDDSVSNIYQICNTLNVDLETKVANWDVFKKITRSFFLAGVSDPDTPTDVGIFKTMYETAYKENIKYVFNGHSFRTEGIEPLDWTYMDGKYIESIHKKFGDGDLKDFDNFYISDLVKYKIFRRIKTILPLNYIEYDHHNVDKVLKNELNWKYYGGHHHESLLTKFIVSVYLPEKFNIDRRMTGLSAMIRSGKIQKQEAEKMLNTQINIEDKEKLTNYILGKLDLTKDQYSQIMSKKNKNFRDFKTYYNLFKYLKYPALLANKLGFVPKILYLRYYGSRN
jgi:N-acetyl sugar amidotransferase